MKQWPTVIRAELLPGQATTPQERASLFEGNLPPVEKRLFELIRIEEPIHVDELVETTRLSSSGHFVRWSAQDDPVDAGEAVRSHFALGSGKDR